MGPRKSLFVLALVCLFAASAFADVLRVTPPVVRFGDLESFVTLHGTGLYGTEMMLITVSGPGGTFSQEANSASDQEVTFSVPPEVAFTSGVYTAVLQSKNFEEPVRTFTPIQFAVEDIVEVGGAPLLAIPEGLFAEATSANGAVVTFTVTALNYDDTLIAVTCSRQSGETFAMGASEVQCSAANEYGVAEGSFFIVVSDLTRPVLTLPANIVTEDAVVTYTATATDNVDGPLTPTCHPASGSVFPEGRTTVQCFVADAHLNYAFGTFTVLRPEQPPVITVPANIILEAPSTAGMDVYFEATSTNDGVIVCTPGSATTFAIGTTLVTCTASNTAGSDTKTFTVTVFTNADATPPVIAVPANITTEATSADGAVVTYTVTATDDVDGSVAVTCSPASGSTFALGTKTVQCTASDVSGNKATRSFTITVRDTTAPVIVSASATPETLWPPNHKMADIVVTAQALDVVDASPTLQIASVSSNQPVNGTGDGDMSPDWIITGPMSVQVRSERSGDVDRVYTIYVTATDESGNTATRTVQVKVTQLKRRAAR
jgi:hypothetical protein